MFLRLLSAMVLLALLLNKASATDYLNSDQLNQSYPQPLRVTSTPLPTQLDYANSFFNLGQYTVLPDGGGTVVNGGIVNSNAFIAGGPVITSLQQRLDGALSQIQQTQQGLATALSQIQQTQRGLAATAAMANI
ncbi:hypothetical protein [Bradyrhizobium genosp. P]|uniref:hypothetical protein n=1 Tax=Bradyrhizobium genosp. P TaxID=83641 RepID=UPI003CF471D9